MSDSREQRIVGVPAGSTPEIGRWLWCLEEARRRTLQRIERFDPKLVDWEAPESGNSVGCILYHIAAIALDYVYADLLGQPIPDDVIDLFPYEIREEKGRLTPIRHLGLDWYLHRLVFAHNRVLEIFREMALEDFHRVRHLTDRAVDITPEWVLYHLTQHEAEHRGELAAIRARAEAGSQRVAGRRKDH